MSHPAYSTDTYSYLNPTPIYSSASTNFSSIPQSVRRTTSTNARSSLAQHGSNMIKEDSRRVLDSPTRDYSSLNPPIPSLPQMSSISSKPDKFTSFYSPNINSYSRYSETPSNKFTSGLRNLGNTCYMNSILQCLAHLVPFREALMSMPQDRIKRNSKLEGKLAESFIKLLLEMKNGVKGLTLNPIEVKTQMGKFSKAYKGMEQNDSAEFFREFLEALAQDLNRNEKTVKYQEMTGNINESVVDVADRWWKFTKAREDSVVSDFFQGQMVSVTTCMSCGYGSVSCDCFLSINLPSAHKASLNCELEQCLDLLFRESVVEGYKCEKCKSVGGCRQKLFVYRFPRILALQIKRFQATAVSRVRLSNEISFKETLDVGRYKHQLARQPPSYTLKAISHHRGSLYSGHYISECKEGSTWYCFDDSRVSETLTPHASSSAYLLFYQSL